jgi:hypothetical protein
VFLENGQSFLLRKENRMMTAVFSEKSAVSSGFLLNTANICDFGCS